jgi:hypothetical protein
MRTNLDSEADAHAQRASVSFDQMRSRAFCRSTVTHGDEPTVRTHVDVGSRPARSDGPTGRAACAWLLRAAVASIERHGPGKAQLDGGSARFWRGGRGRSRGDGGRRRGRRRGSKRGARRAVVGVEARGARPLA